MSPSGVHLNKSVVILIVGLLVCVVFVYRYMRSPPAMTEIVKDKAAGNVVPSKVAGDVVSITLGDKILPIYTQSMKPTGEAKLDILFLHGMSFTSQNWVDLGTLKQAADAGYNAVAVDLPGYGKSKDVHVDDNAKFMTALIAGLKLNKPIIVSPSMSGSFSLPFLFSDPKSTTSLARGFVPIAPVNTGKYKDSYSKNEIPTLIVFGSRDASLGPESKKNLEILPKGKVFEIPNAGHACYMNKPDVFHKGFFDFLSSLIK